MSYWAHFPESLSRIKQLFINNFFPMDFVPFISGQSLLYLNENELLRSYWPQITSESQV